ncbi:MAG: carboxypeptidase-like regulatory domain-containing protein [Rhodothermaceae bacterium]
MKYIFTIIILLCTFITSSAQYIDGKVYELNKNNKRVLLGVNIIWMGSTVGTTTNLKGEFRIKRVSSTDKLIFSYVGYKSDTLQVTDSKNYYEVTLKGLREIEEIEVVEKNGAFFDQTQPLQTQNITKSELQKAACCNLAESFETNASVDVDYSDAVSGAKQIRLLGLAGKYTQVMQENIPGIRGLATTYGLNYIPGPWMESIQISKGTASVINGYESITGQINVEFKKPDQDEKFYIDWYQNSKFKSDINANYSHKINDELSTMVLAHGEYSYKGVDNNSDSFYDMPKMRQINVMNRWKYLGKNGIAAQLGVSYINESREAGQKSYDDSKPRTTSNGYGIGVDTERFEVFTKTGYVFSNLESTTFGWINKLVVHKQNSFFGLKDYDGKQISYYSNFIYSTILGTQEHKLTFGGSYVYDKYEETLNQENFDKTESVPGLYFQYTYAPNPAFVLMAGLRADFHNNYGTFYTPRFHLKYNFDERTIARLSVGKGYRSANVIAENSPLLASSRNFKFLETPEQEEVWNYGIAFTRYFKMFDKELTVNLEYHRTEFKNQVVVDQDSDSDNILIYNLDGDAYSNNYQLEMLYSPVERLDLLFAFRITDVKTTINNKLTEKPLVSKYKSLFTLSYLSDLRLWQYDVTFQYNGEGRIPDRSTYLYGKEYDPFLVVNFQITRYFRYFDAYFGAENLTGYKQDDPIISAENPFSKNFDASTVWAPITGAKFYLGLRYSL